MDTNAILKSSLKGASESSGRSEGSEFVCWYYESVTANIRTSQDAEGPRHRCKRQKCGKVGLGIHSREASALEASKKGLAETRYVDMVSVGLNALEIGAVLLLERNCETQSGFESCVTVTVFAPGKCTNSCKSSLDLSARKVKGQLRDVSFLYVNPRMSQTSDTSHDVSFLCCNKRTEACVYHEGCGTKLELESD